MPIPSRATLKSYFETNDQPTQAQFAELVDAIYDLAQQANDAADAAAATVAALTPKVARCSGTVSLNITSFSGLVTTKTDLKLRDCTVGVVLTPTSVTGFTVRCGVVMTITPNANFDDDDFQVLTNIENWNNTNLTVLGLTVGRATNACVLTFQIIWTAVPQSKIIQFAIFD